MNAKRKFNIFDNFNNNEHGFRGHVIFGKGRYQKEYKGPNGIIHTRSEFEEVTYEDKNIVTICGYQYAFKKLFNIGRKEDRSTLVIQELNHSAPMMGIGIPTSEYNDDITESDFLDPDNIHIHGNDYIFGFMVGDGAGAADNVTYLAPNYKNRSLYNPVPFRILTGTNTLSDTDAAKYYGKSIIGEGTASQATSYYIKKFDSLPQICHVWVNDDGTEVVDDTVFSSTSSVPIESYVEMNITIGGDDCRDYFTTTGSPVRINELCLVAGYPKKDSSGKVIDYCYITAFSHFTRPSITLEEDDEIECIYRLYAR